MRGAAALVFAMISVAAVAASRQQPAPPRDATAAVTSGTASVSGTVVNDEDKPVPVRRAIVTLSGDGLRPSRSAISDDEGRFTISGLPAGRFTLTVSRASFITSTFGAKRPARPGTPIAVADGAHVMDLVVRLWRGAVVAGVLRDDTGAPVKGIEVHAVPARAVGGLLTLSNNGAVTNELGEFRIFGLEPGTYVVMARPVASGTQIVAMSEAEVDAAIDAIRRRQATGAMPTTTPTPAPPAQPPFAYAPVYYPGTPVLAQAAPITLAAGQEQAGLDFALQRLATAVISGTVVRPDGTPAAGASLQLTATAPAGAFASAASAELNTTAAADGTFRFAQVTPGAYRLAARAAAEPAKAPAPSSGLVTAGPTGPQLWATADLSIAGTDLKGMALRLDAGTTVAGTVAFESDTLKPPANLTAIRLWLVPPSMLLLKPGTPITSITFTPSVAVRSDGTFEVPSVAPGTYRLVISGAAIDGSGWWARSAITGDRDLLDRDIDIGSGLATMTVQVVFSDRRSELSGMLQAASGEAASDVFVIAFAADRRYWGPGSRRVQAVRPGVDGRFLMKDLPAGEYLLAAVADIDQDQWTDPTFLEQLISAAVKVSIAPGEKRVQDLRIGR